MLHYVSLPEGINPNPRLHIKNDVFKKITENQQLLWVCLKIQQKYSPVNMATTNPRFVDVVPNKTCIFGGFPS